MGFNLPTKWPCDNPLNPSAAVRPLEVYSLDFETRSTCDLKATGAYRYAEDPSTEVILLRYRRGDTGPTTEWRPGWDDPVDLLDHVRAGGIIRGHNVAFERLIWNIALPRMGCGHWPKLAIDQVDCTMIRALALALPASLDHLGAVLQLTVQKDMVGSALMKKMCRPRKARKGEDPSKIYWIEDAASVDRLGVYCGIDVETEAAAGQKLHRLSDSERAYWHLDQTMNDRGIALDLKNARKLMAICTVVTARADAQMATLTEGQVTKTSQAGALTKWLQSRGIECESVGKDEIDDVIKNARWCGDNLAVEVLLMRKEFAKASTAKIKTMFECVCADGRARGQIQFGGAAITGRDAGRLIQVQNLPRVDAKDDLPKVEQILQILEECGNNIPRMVERISLEVGPVLPLVSKCLRGLLIAEKGKKLIGGDLSNIEGRGALWLAGDEEGLARFVKIDEGLLPDVYVMAYSESFGTPVDQVTPEQRGVGKVIVLACGFGGGVGAFVRFATEKLLKSIVNTVRSAVSTETWDNAYKRFTSRRDKCDITRDQWTAIKITVDAWRRANPKIVQLWYDLEEAAIQAVENPGRPVAVGGGKIIYVFQKGFLWCRLPSGRPLAYFNPAVVEKFDEMIRCRDGKMRLVEDVDSDELAELIAAGVEIEKRNGKKCVEFEGMAQRSKGGGKVWVRRIPGGKNNLSLYGGRQLENCLAGDTEVLTHNGWKPITHVLLSDLVWDGVNWVRHEGLIRQGTRETHRFGGVGMTHDHKVWTDEGWKQSKSATLGEVEAASPLDQFDRPCVRKMVSTGVCGERREEIPLEGSLRMRRRENLGRVRAYEGQDEELRVSSEGALRRNPHRSRHVESSSLWGLAVLARPMQAVVASGLQKLRRAWDNGLSRMGLQFCRLLGGYGACLSGRTGDRARGQQQRVLQGQLHLDDRQEAGTQQANQPRHQYPEGAYARLRSSGAFEDRQNDAALPGGRKLARESDVHPAGRFEQVYDLRNAGPNHRFAVRAPGGGRPFLVSNCDQAMCRDIMFHGMALAERAGLPHIMRVHDELVCEADADREDLNPALLKKCMTTNPRWLPGFPLAAKCWEDTRYVK